MRYLIAALLVFQVLGAIERRRRLAELSPFEAAAPSEPPPKPELFENDEFAKSEPILTLTLGIVSAMVLLVLAFCGALAHAFTGDLRQSLNYAAYLSPILAAFVAGGGLYTERLPKEDASVKAIFFFEISLSILTFGLACFIGTLDVFPQALSNFLGLFGFAGSIALLTSHWRRWRRSRAAAHWAWTVALLMLLTLSIAVIAGWFYLHINGDRSWGMLLIVAIRRMFEHL